MCPVCGAQTDKVYDRHERRVFACNRCQTDIIVPLAAWQPSLPAKKGHGRGTRIKTGSA